MSTVADYTKPEIMLMHTNRSYIRTFRNNSHAKAVRWYRPIAISPILPHFQSKVGFAHDFPLVSHYTNYLYISRRSLAHVKIARISRGQEKIARISRGQEKIARGTRSPRGPNFTVLQ